MKRLFYVSALLLVSSVSYSSHSYVELYKRVSPTTVTIINPKAHRMGSGVFLDSIHVLTAAHLLARPDDRLLIVTLPDGAVRNASVMTVDLVNDLALLTMADTVINTKAVRRAKSDPEIGEPVFIVGAGLGLPWGATQGIVTGLNRLDKGFIQTDASINHGNSGGPAFNKRGELIGIVDALIQPIDGGPGCGLIIPISKVNSFLDRFTLSIG